MRFTQMVSKTLREDPPEAETASHRLLLKAGLIYQVAAGVYAYLPLAWRSLRKIENIIRSMRVMQSLVDVPIEKMITHQYPLAEVNLALQSHVDLSAMVPVVNHTLG